ncbi:MULTISPECIES: NUDIX hydrolase [unclassified Clostridium]|uniref:NUDIX hydrolase n=1 Tax=unclassified Clostridium TaxID=2614128 RepID=UPI0002974018|nr:MULTISPECIES: NUDIX hydrolase [unclassified Clostridium]EKQ57191.1 MAG: ADP-ribose pyrophosphatase [Clostridium sp. Maddingley MBC34-26]
MNWIGSIKEYRPYNEQEKNDKEIIIKYSNMFNDILTRDNDVIHITSSAFIINQSRDKALMIHHNIYNSWAWTGGHADGEDNLLLVAINEAKEETGVKNFIPICNEIISIDILPVFGHIKRGKYVSSHLHASIAYLIEADENETLTVKPDENSGVKWIPIDEIKLYSSEPHMIKVYQKIIDKIKK